VVVVDDQRDAVEKDFLEENNPSSSSAHPFPAPTLIRR
jgi:hypothetical protein